jgi:type VII secretion protein EccB
MPSQQDHLHSYQFTVQRVVAALVLRETDPVQGPFRKTALAALASLLTAAIALGGVALHGVVVGGDATNWRDASAVIVEKESGARYVYREGRLHLTVNYASALLVVGTGVPRTVLVSRTSIQGVPRGAPLGIPGAPDSLPPAELLATGAWAACSMPLDDPTGVAASVDQARALTAPLDAGRAPLSVLLVGAAPGRGFPLGDDAVLAEADDGSLHLLWHNRRHPIHQRRTVLAALGWSSHQPVRVATAALNSFTAGDPLQPVEIARRGAGWSERAGARVGQVFVVESFDGGRQYAVALPGGLASLTQVQVDLLLTDQRTKELVGQTKPTEMSQGDFASIPKLPNLQPDRATVPPATTPKLADAGTGALCAVVAGEAGVTEVLIGAADPDVGVATQTSARAASGTVLADYVLVAPGRGAVVESVAAPGATGGALSVVTDLGRRYPVSRAEVLTMLGYDGVRPLRLPASVVSLVPSGRALDPEAASMPATDG